MPPEELILLLAGLILCPLCLCCSCYVFLTPPGAEVDKCIREGKETTMIAGRTIHEHRDLFMLNALPMSCCLSLGCLVAWIMVRNGSKLGLVLGVSIGIFGSCTFLVCMLITSLRHVYFRPGVSAIYKADKKVEDALKSGAVRLLSCAWLSDRNVSVMKRRQELPEDAFLSPGEAHTAFMEGRVFVLSYGWLTALHPDPHGLVLLAVLAFLSHGSVAQYNPLAYGLFWDFASIPQRGSNGEPRSDEENKTFKEGLKVMSDFYGSLWKTVVIQLTQLPVAPSADVEYNTNPYPKRGWCVMEDGVSRLAAFHERGVRSGLSKLMDISGGECVPHVPGEKPAIAELEALMEAATFTGKGDREIVMGQLKSFNAMLHIGGNWGKHNKDIVRKDLKYAGASPEIRAIGVTEPTEGGIP